MDASIFYNSKMRLIWSEDPMQKSYMVTRFDKDIFNGKCNYGSSCMKMLLDTQVAIYLDMTGIGTITSSKSVNTI